MKYKLIPVGFSELIKQENLSVSVVKKFKHLNDNDGANKSRPLFLHKDVHNVVFLMFLYFLQGIPLGLKASLPYILGARHVSYANQALFSLASWPFSLKLLWAPIVDSIFSPTIGRRKSWLVPVQYLIGIFMLFFANYVHEILERKETITGEDINILTAIFFLFTFLSATQDIAVDGWGLTILSKENMNWASICNNAGSTTGMLVGNSIFLVLESSEFCNLYIRPYLGLSEQQFGIVTLREFMKFFGIVFIVSTTLILWFKRENAQDTQEEKRLSIGSTFSLLFNILKLNPVQKLMIILFTCKIAFATHGIRHLKMIEAGVPKEKLGLINGGFQIVQILTPLMIVKFLNLNQPLDIFIRSYPSRMILTVVLTVWVYYTPLFKNSDDEYPLHYFFLYILLNGLYSFVFSIMALSKTAFFTQISDKKIGGTYMTLLNTISNIGVHWPATSALFLIDFFSLKECNFTQALDESKLTSSKVKGFANFLKTIDENTCSSEVEFNNCIKYGAKCVLKLDAFYYLTVLCTIIGVFWLFWFKRTIFNLQTLPKSCWKISNVVSVKKNQLVV